MSKKLKRPMHGPPTQETVTEELIRISHLLADQRAQTNHILQQALEPHTGMYEQLKTEQQFGERATDQKMTEAVLHVLKTTQQ